jgi:fumarate reductase flavoprotein subunit
MVERCADCGFDLAAGLVEVVPTAHYMMGGVEFGADARTELEGLFAAGEDTGGVHGANRLGGNGVANSTVFGGIAGDTLAAWTPRAGEWRDPMPGAIEEAEARARAPLARRGGNLGAIREELYTVMWEHVGILRDAAGLAGARAKLRELEQRLHESGIGDTDLRYNLTWHDWLNLSNLLSVSRAICAAADARRESRGAHFREDFPETGDLATSAFSRVRSAGASFDVSFAPVVFSRVKPGQTLLAA